MTEHTGRLLASGRTADVVDLGDGTVLRRYRIDRDTTIEARAMEWVRRSNVAVPKVHRADGRDLVMERVQGPTLLEDLGRRPWTILSAARTLASLQRHVNSLTAPGWFPVMHGVPEGSSVLHLDLHPMNIILSERGPVIIDWTNASRGPARFDAAMSTVIMSSFEAQGGRDRAGRSVLVRGFSASRGRSLVRSGLSEACRYRLTDPNVTDGERAAIRRLWVWAEHRHGIEDRG